MTVKTKALKVRNWVTALRSGKYAQCTGALYRVKGEKGQAYCCLGVACELEPDLVMKDEVGKYGWLDDEGRRRWDLGTLPDPLRELYPTVFSMTEGGKQFSVIALNDSYGLSFEQIADVLESVFLGDGKVAQRIIEGTDLRAHVYYQGLEGFARAKALFFEEIDCESEMDGPQGHEPNIEN